jgi:hypothetical protein
VLAYYSSHSQNLDFVIGEEWGLYVEKSAMVSAGLELKLFEKRVQHLNPIPAVPHRIDSFILKLLNDTVSMQRLYNVD